MNIERREIKASLSNFKTMARAVTDTVPSKEAGMGPCGSKEKSWPWCLAPSQELGGNCGTHTVNGQDAEGRKQKHPKRVH